MLSETDRKLMLNFFSSYFHEDWDLDAPTTAELVAKYVRTSADEEHLHALSRAIIEYLKAGKSDEELERSLFHELGCYYAPSANGLSARTWLETVSNQLLAAT